MFTTSLKISAQCKCKVCPCNWYIKHKCSTDTWVNPVTDLTHGQSCMYVYRIPFNIQPSQAKFSIPAFDVILQSQIIANCGTGTWTAYRISLCPNVSILHINCLHEKNCSAFNDGFDFKLSIFYRIVTHH